MAEYLNRITGASFEIKSDDVATSGIVLGTLAQFPNESLTKVLEIRNGYDGKEAYAIRTEASRVLLIGATDTGAAYAAFHLLEHVGCRRFFLSPAWEIVPSLPTLAVSLNIDERPAVLSRNFAPVTVDPFDRWGLPEDGKVFERDLQAWCRFNRHGESMTVHTSHALSSVGTMFATEFAAHPEYWAMVKGKRVAGNQLCLSKPEVRRLMGRYAVAILDQHPTWDMVNLEPEDGDGACECEVCEKSTLSDLVFGAANDAARIVARERPGKMVGLGAYYKHSDPPSFNLEPNVHVQRTIGFVRSKFDRAELERLWTTRCQNLGVYEYFDMPQTGLEPLPGSRAANISYLRESITRIAPWLKSCSAEGGGTWGANGLGYYIANRLLWNPKTDVNALLDDFFTKSFGTAAAPMRRYYERFDPGNDPMVSAALFAAGCRDLSEATQLAKECEDVLERIAELKAFMIHQSLRWQLQYGSDDAKKAQTLRLLTFNYRIRRTYMTSWLWMNWYGARRWARTFNEPSWSYITNNHNPPWRDEPAYTRAEIEKMFQEATQVFGTDVDDASRRQFSQDLVAVKLRDEVEKPSVITARFSRGVICNVYRFDTASFQFQALVSTGKRDGREGVVRFRDAGGALLSEVPLLLHGEPQRFEFAFPRAGSYTLEVISGYDVVLTLPAGTCASFDLSRMRDVLKTVSLEQAPALYVYVPRESETFGYFYAQTGRHRVFRPDDSVAVDAGPHYPDGALVKVAVPRGSDGKAWRIDDWQNVSELRFANIPAYLSTSPNVLLVPREVAESDKLQIVGP